MKVTRRHLHAKSVVSDELVVWMDLNGALSLWIYSSQFHWLTPKSLVGQLCIHLMDQHSNLGGGKLFRAKWKEIFSNQWINTSIPLDAGLFYGLVSFSVACYFPHMWVKLQSEDSLKGLAIFTLQIKRWHISMTPQCAEQFVPHLRAAKTTLTKKKTWFHHVEMRSNWQLDML